MKHISALTALTLITLASSGQVLAREGEYYEGASEQHTEASRIDRNSTGSVSAVSADNHAPKRTVDSGDYYEGIQRPN